MIRTKRPPAKPDLLNVYVPFSELYREQIEPPRQKPTRSARLIRTTPLRDPFQ
jgi:hypothetical protein